MKRLLRLRLSLLLFGLAALPVLALPFAEKLRLEWERYWEPEVAQPSVICAFDSVPFAAEEVVWDDEPQELVEILDYDVPVPISLAPVLGVERMGIPQDLTVPVNPFVDLPDA